MVQEERKGALQDAIGELKEGPRELVDLYNDYVCPWTRWGIALEMVEIANYGDAAYIRQLWDVYLRQVSAACALHVRCWLQYGGRALVLACD